jgi:ferredoxin
LKGEIIMPRGDGTGPLGNGPLRGRGMGRGGGGGMGRGLGRGRGCGMGQGMGMGKSEMFISQTPSETEPLHPPQPSENPIPEKQELEKQLELLKQQMEMIRKRIDELGSKGEKIPVEKPSVVAVVDKEKCNGCGICANVCPQGAITVDEIANVNLDKCSGCGICVENCPNGAITLKN